MINKNFLKLLVLLWQFRNLERYDLQTVFQQE